MCSVEMANFVFLCLLVILWSFIRCDVTGEEPHYCPELSALMDSVMAKYDMAEIPFVLMHYDCEKDGRFQPLQCDDNGICGCVNAYGNLIARTVAPPNKQKPVCKGLKAGQCPFSKDAVSCDVSCTSDAECPSNLKCCTMDCGMTCVEPTQECFPKEYSCSDGLTCVPDVNVCDGLPDCPDGGDELACAKPRFECPYGRMIGMENRCDGKPDCVDESDEMNCDEAGDFCHGSGLHKCPDGRCIGNEWICDGYDDCSDGSDEICELIPCGNGIMITEKDVCDYMNHCRDNSDEENCSYRPGCGGDFVQQCDSGECMDLDAFCNGYEDCADGSDEINCLCDPPEHRCGDGLCMYKWTVCNGYEDCADGSDEENCSKTCPYWEHTCKNGQCISTYDVCDLEDDCGDNSDEEGCVCKSWHFDCGEKCIEKWKRCDGHEDCIDGSDEDSDMCEPFVCSDGEVEYPLANCNGHFDCADHSDEIPCECEYYQFKCDNGLCIHNDYVCNGEDSCGDNSDEIDCDCTESRFRCDNGRCIRDHKMCDLTDDCGDNSDEQDRACYFHTCDDGETLHLGRKYYNDKGEESGGREVVCNGWFQCEDHSDELNCECRTYYFKCPNGLCVAGPALCDGYDNCGDMWDESDCGDYI